jgi:predicted nucleotidyltransferase
LNINYYEVSIEDASRRLRGILSGMMDVKVAVLFGSILRRKLIRDLDIGVFMNPEPNIKRIAEISGILEDALGLPVDVIPLNWASPKLKLKALLNSVKLIVRDSNLYTSLNDEWEYLEELCKRLIEYDRKNADLEK